MMNRLSARAFAKTKNALSFGRNTFKRYIASSRNPMLPDDEQDKLLFTPGPLTTSWTTKQAATRDLGSRDIAFIQIIKDLRSELLKIANVDSKNFTTVPVQGSGTFGVEAVLTTAVPRGKKVLIIANGAYGLRQTAMAKANDMDYVLQEYPDNEAPCTDSMEQALIDDPDITHVSMVHSETTSGIVNDVETMGKLVRKHGRTFIVDAMSSFGAIPVDLEDGCIDYIVSSANKCIEGIPGFSYAICRSSALEASEGNARTLSMDIHDQARGLDKDGQFRFTPPTHAILAFKQALAELEEEGGQEARLARYQENQRICQQGMEKLGFKLYLEPEKQGCIISSYHYPADPNWDFSTFYEKLNERDFVIYPGKVSKADCFRIGHIGRIFPEDTAQLIKHIQDVVKEMNIENCSPTV